MERRLSVLRVLYTCFRERVSCRVHLPLALRAPSEHEAAWAQGAAPAAFPLGGRGPPSLLASPSSASPEWAWRLNVAITLKSIQMYCKTKQMLGYYSERGERTYFQVLFRKTTSDDRINYSEKDFGLEI